MSTALNVGCSTADEVKQTEQTKAPEKPAHWSYAGEDGPENWGSLDPKFSACKTGLNQSPIDLAGFIESDLSALKLTYKPGIQEVINNGHTIQVNYKAGSSLSIDGAEYDLKQFHFHAPSEDKLNGKSYAMEAHLVHADKDGKLAVVGVMIEEGAENEALKAIWADMPEKADEKKTMASEVSVEGILPSNRDYYRFNGSLTTPPCSEGVLWLVLKNPLTTSKEQVAQFSQTVGHPNNRPVQPTNARGVLE